MFTIGGIHGVRMLKSFSDSQLLATKIGPSLTVDEGKPMPPSRKKHSNLEVIKAYAPIVTALIAMFSALVVAGMQTQSATNTQLDSVVAQVNSKVIGILEEQMQELKDKNEELEDKLANLTETCRDVQKMVIAKFGNSAALPVRRLRPSIREEPERIKLHKLVVPKR